MQSSSVTTYDLAFSFAGEQREYVEATKRACERLGLRVFYDRDLSNEWWGKNFIREQRRVYGSRTKYFVPFLSTEYLAKPIPMDEFSAAMMTDVRQGDGYVLPVLLGNVEVPPDLLHPHVHYLRGDDYTPEELASQLQRRVGVADSRGQVPQEVSTVVKRALSVRLPKVVPQTFSKYREQQAVYDFLSERFSEALPQLEATGFIGTLLPRHDQIAVRIERAEGVVYSLDIIKGGIFGDDDKLSFRVGSHRSGSGGVNGWVEPFYDKEIGLAKLRVSDLSFLGSFSSAGERVMTKEELFDKLWDRIVDQLERL